MTDYQPLSCDLHDELEVAALRGVPVRLCWLQADGSEREAVGVVRTITARQGEEFVLFAVADEDIPIRLDRLALHSFPLRSPPLHGSH
ncbi:MAG: transcriptional antiterminator [Pseudomonadota bacterium]